MTLGTLVLIILAVLIFLDALRGFVEGTDAPMHSIISALAVLVVASAWLIGFVILPFLEKYWNAVVF